MNKLKKLIVIAMSLVMALALAVPAFADEASDKKKLKDELAKYGISASEAVDALTTTQLTDIKSRKGELEKLANETRSNAKANPQKAQEFVDAAVASVNVPGLAIVAPKVEMKSDELVVNATVEVAGRAISASATAPLNDRPNDDPPTPNNGTTPNGSANGVAANGSVANVATTYSAPAVVNPMTAVTSASVIKATGDNSAVAIVAAVLSVVAVLGLGFRKNSSMNVA